MTEAATQVDRLPTAGGRETLRALGELSRGHRLLAVLTFLVLVAGAAVGLANPLLLGRIVELVVSGEGAGAITQPAVLLALAALVEGVLLAVGVSLTASLGERMLARLRERVVGRALTVPLDQIERAGTGDLLARVGGDVGVISDATRMALPEIAGAGLTVVLTFVGLAFLNPWLALAGLVAAPIQILSLRWYLRRSSPIYARERIAEGDQAQQLLESIGGASTVRTFRWEQRHVALVRGRSEAAVRRSMEAVSARSFFFARLNGAELVGLSCVLIAGFILVRAGQATVGEATAAALFFHRLFDPIGALLILFDSAQAAAAALARLVGVLSMPVRSVGTRSQAPPHAGLRILEMEHEYLPGHPVLQSLSLDVEPGETVAIVGESGAGKSTVGKLVAGVHEPTRGSIELGGVDIGEFDEMTLRRSVALVTQEIHVFAGSVRDDLRLAKPAATDEELWEVVGAVGATDAVQRLPEGLDTMVGSGGHSIGPTVAQQLALARVLLADPGVVVLDEATAETGSAGARTLEAAVARVLEGRTGIVIAHRLSQVVGADRIVVMDRGAIREAGTHEELLRLGGRYAALWEAWSAGRLHSAPTE